MAPDTRANKALNTKKSHGVKVFITTLITILILASIGAGTYIYYILSFDTFYSGIYIDNMSMEGLELSQGIELLKEYHKPTLEAMHLQLEHEDQVWEFDYTHINAYINIDEVVQEAYSVGREGNIIERLIHILDAGKHDKRYSTTLTYDVSLLKEELEKIGTQINITPVDATITFLNDSNNLFSFTEEIVGKGLLVEDALSELKSRVDNNDFTKYSLPVETLYPKYTIEEVKTWTSKISTYSTKLSGTKERIHNITLSSQSFDGYRLDPGEIFSLNAITGPRDLSTGYKNAPVIVQGKKLSDEPGGGNCQTSTTLYGAIIRADLEIVERWHHSWPSSYTVEGQDSTIDYPNVDIKFKNNKDTPVFINRQINNGNITVNVYGKAPEDYDSIDIITSVISRSSVPPEKVVKDNTLLKGQEIIEYQSRPEIKTQTYRVYYKDGVEVKRIKEAYSHYRRIVGKKRVGTKEPPRETKQEKTQLEQDASD